MTLDEAIEIKETELEGTAEHSEEDLSKAEILSIEAMKRITYQRKDHLSRYSELLPGETEE